MPVPNRWRVVVDEATNPAGEPSFRIRSLIHYKEVTCNFSGTVMPSLSRRVCAENALRFEFRSINKGC